MLDTSARLLQLLSLLQSRRFWSGAQLAERLEITERTVRRDMDRLRSLGYPVEAAAGVAGGYQLGAGAALPPLLLQDDEALAISIALGTAAGNAVTGIGEAALRALVKLEQVLPTRLRKRAKALRAAVVPLPYGGPAIDASTLALLAGACRDHEQLRFRYEDSSGIRSERNTEPQGLVHTGSRWYLVAWDVTRADWRTFRVDRIVGKVTPGLRFAPRAAPDGDLKIYVARSLTCSTTAVQARVLLHAPLERIAKRIPTEVGRLEAVDTERCRLVVGAQSLETLARWILYLDTEFEVEEPPELTEQFRSMHARLGRSLKVAASTRHSKLTPTARAQAAGYLSTIPTGQ